MACDYHGRIDFRAFDVIADAIIKATPAELDAAIVSCAEIANGDGYQHAPMHRMIFRAFAAMLRLYKRKYA
jgi:hypothetical protein